MFPRSLLSLLGFSMAAALLPLPALAQMEAGADAARIERLERSLMTLQRQVSRGETASPAGVEGMPPAGAGAASIQVHLSQIEEQLRAMRGKMEENDFRINQLTDKMDRLQKDTEFRFGQINANAAAPPIAPAAPAPAPVVKKPLAGGPQNLTPNDDIIPAIPEETLPVDTEADMADTPEPPPPAKAPEPAATSSAGDGSLKLPDAKSGSNAREQYNQAFKLLNQTKYDDAAVAFRDFIARNPKDPLIGNAYYWLGETHYIHRDYVKAADTFRQGFEVLPNGPKAADNLLKLSMSLGAMKKQKEACIVLDQILQKFSKSSASVTQKAQAERTRQNCE